MRKDAEFLIDHADPEVLRIGGRAEPDYFTFDSHFPVIVSLDSGQQFHGRAFSGAVFADQAMDFSFHQVEVDATQHADRAVALAYAAQFEYWGIGKWVH